MIAVDTNIVVRLLTHDDDKQFKKAQALFRSEGVFIPDTVILETEWVLRYAYSFAAADIHDAFLKLVGLSTVSVANPIALQQALDWYDAGCDFADAMHLAHSQACESFRTFDKAFIKKAPYDSSCGVQAP